MRDSEALRLLVAACQETLADARAGGTWLVDMIPALERLCGLLQSELDART